MLLIPKGKRPQNNQTMRMKHKKMKKKRSLTNQLLLLMIFGLLITGSFIARADSPEQIQQYKYALGLIQRQLYEEAGKVLNRILSEPTAFSKSDGALFWLAECEYRQKKFTAAAALYNQLLVEFPDSIFRDRGAYGLGWAHTKDDNPKSAIEAFSKVTKQDLQLWIDANMKRGFLMVKFGMSPNKVISIYQELLKEDNLTNAQRYECNLQIGIGKFNKSIFKQAIPHFEKALELSAKNKKQPILFYIAESYFRFRDYKKASSWYAKVLAEGPKTKIAQKASYSLAWCEIKKKNPEKALEIFERLAKQPDSPVRYDALKNLIDLQMNLHKYESASKWITLASEILKGKDKENMAYMSGLVKSRLGEFTSSIKSFDYFIKNYPKSSKKDEAIYQKGLVNISLGKFKTALKSFEKIKSEKTKPSIREKAIYRIGECYFNLGNLKVAGENFHKLIKLFPKGQAKYDALYQLGEIAYISQKFNDALLAFDAIGESGGDLASQAIFRAGEVLMKASRFNDAIARFNLYLEKFPKGKLKEDAIFKIGLSFLELKDQGQALAAFSQLRDAKGYFRQEARFQIAEIAQTLGNYPLAIQHYKAILTEEPKHPLTSRSRRAVGICLYKTGDYPAAIKNFKSVLKDYPASDAATPESRLWLGKSLIASDKIEDGILEALKVPVLYPKSEHIASAYAVAAKAYSKLGKKDKSQRMWKEVLKSAPSSELKKQAEEALK